MHANYLRPSEEWMIVLPAAQVNPVVLVAPQVLLAPVKKNNQKVIINPY